MIAGRPCSAPIVFAIADRAAAPTLSSGWSSGIVRLNSILPAGGAGGSSTVFAEESPTRSARFDAENDLYSFALTVPVDASQPFKLAVVPGDRLGEGAVDIQTLLRACLLSVSVRSKGELAGNTTSTDPRSQRIRESRKGRSCSELGLSAHCLSSRP